MTLSNFYRSFVEAGVLGPAHFAFDSEHHSRVVRSPDTLPLTHDAVAKRIATPDGIVAGINVLLDAMKRNPGAAREAAKRLGFDHLLIPKESSTMGLYSTRPLARDEAMTDEQK